MTRTIEEARAYGRGYQCGLKGKWPADRPPFPPNDVIAALMKAALGLRESTDHWIAQLGFEDEDPIVQEVLSKCDAVDDAMKLVTAFLLDAALGKERT